jgi:hypothetical protein
MCPLQRWSAWALAGALVAGAGCDLESWKKWEPWDQEDLSALEVVFEVGSAEVMGRPQPLAPQAVYRAEVSSDEVRARMASCPVVYQRHERTVGACAASAVAAQPSVLVFSLPVTGQPAGEAGENLFRAIISPEDRYWGQYWSNCPGCQGQESILVRLPRTDGTFDEHCTGPRGALPAEGADRLDLTVLPAGLASCAARFVRSVPPLRVPGR